MDIIGNKIRNVTIIVTIAMLIISIVTPVFASNDTSNNQNFITNLLSKIWDLIKSIFDSFIDLFNKETDPPTPPTPTPPTPPEETNYIFIGDSRTVGMLKDAKTNIEKTGKIIKKFAVVGANYDRLEEGNLMMWLDDIKLTCKNAPKGTKVIIWLGVNDLFNVKNYISTVNSLANSYKDLEFYYVSVTPVNEEKAKNNYSVKNSDIVNFNNKMQDKDGLNSEVTYVDVYNSIYDTIVKGTTDGVHYNKTTSQAIWSAIYSEIS